MELVKKMQVMYSRFKDENIIINLTSLKQLKTTDVIEFLQVSNKHREANHSFVIVSNKIELDDIPDELIIVPTLQVVARLP